MKPDELFLDLKDVDLQDYAVSKHEMFNPTHFTSELMDWFATDPNSKGCWLPFNSAGNLRFREGELSVIAGANFSGKSAMWGQAMLSFLRGTKFADKPQKFLLISPEMSPIQNLARLVQQCVAKPANQIADSDVVAACMFLKNKLLILDHVGQIDVEDMVNTVHYATSLGVTAVLLDNLTVMRLPGGAADANHAQQDMVTQLVECARSSGVHLHVIAHTKKMAQGERTDRYSIRGSSTISDLADNVVMIERLFIKERKLAEISLSPEERDKWEACPDSKLMVQKQRHGTAWTGEINLFYDPYSMRWSEQKNAAFKAFDELQDLSELGAGNSRGYQSW